MKRLLKTKVNRNGIKFNKTYYYHPVLHVFIGDNVLFSTKKKLLHINVYSMEGEYICKAKADYFTEIQSSKQKCLSCPYYSQVGNVPKQQ